MKPCCKPSRMCEIRVSIGSLIALAIALCVPSLGAPAQASQHDFIELPQTFVHDCFSAHSRVPPADQAGRVRPNAYYKVSTDQLVTVSLAQVASRENACETFSLVFVPDQNIARISDRLTTRFGDSPKAKAVSGGRGRTHHDNYGVGGEPDCRYVPSSPPLF